MKKPLNPLRHKGFTLVVTLALMILLTVIAVGLLTLSTISLRASGQGTALATARANARMALMLALGDLQKFAGADQRSTAIADIAGTATGDSLAAGAAPLNDRSVTNAMKGLSGVQPGTRYWTGVFANREANPATIYTKTPTPAVMNWLVSGNTADYPTTGPTILPSDSAYAVGSNGKVSDEKKAVILAGVNSVGSDTGSVDRYVVAPVVPVRSTVVGSTSTNPTGSYAYWVGDEGVKARIDMALTRDDNTDYAALGAQRRGWESIAGFENYPISTSPEQANLPKSLTLAGTGLVVPGLAGQTAGSSPLQKVFHSATTNSRSLLTDGLNGGTKVDLTPILAGDLPSSSPIPEITNYPVKSGKIIPRDAARTIRAPLWDTVKEFHDRFSKMSDGNLKVTSSSSDLTPSIAPIITDFRVMFGARVRTRDAAAGVFNVDATGKVAIAIANPYPYPLKWTDNLEIEFKSISPPGNYPARIFALGGTSAPAYMSSNASTYTPGSTAVSSEASVFNNLFFSIKAGTLQPGEGRAYTVPSQVIRPAGRTTKQVVELADFASSSPFSLNNSVILESTNTYTAPFTMDVRESWTTTLAMIEMKLAGSSSRDVLRRVERFELDNAYYAANQRSFTKETARAMTQPFPLMLYSFQISQPGADYKSFMPSLYDMGQRASTIRTFTDFNLQAARIRKPITSYNPPPYFAESNDSLSQLPLAAPGGETGTGFTRNLALSPIRWGRSPSGSEKTVLFTVPETISSLAVLQHADLTGDDTFGSVGHQPGNAVGNSYATPFVKRRLTTESRTDYELTGSGSGATTSRVNYYDIAYLLNAALWDTYFFSTVPNNSNKPENPAMILLDSKTTASTLKDPVESATQLVVEGGFNVNSTDKNAWKAFLASSKHFKHKADSASNTSAAFPRSLEQLTGAATKPTGNDADSFSGFRRLSDTELDNLAAEMVRQVRMRGPFVSVSHFVNRAIADLEAQPALSRSGALQQAIDESGGNISADGTKNAFTRVNASTDKVTLQWKNNAPRADYDGGDLESRPNDANSADPDWAKSSTDNNFGAVASIVSDRKMLSDAKFKPEQGYRSTGIPGWLTQADVLQVIGQDLTARSDTFRIRTMGEAYDAAGKSLAKAYCEAIVQRVPDYLDPANGRSARGATQLTSLNKTYGRQFQIVQFRWLSPNEI